MHAGPIKADHRDVIELDTSKSPLRLVGLAHREDGVAAHLAAQGCRLAQHALVQRHAVPEAIFAHDGHEPVAGPGIGRAQRGKTTFIPHGAPRAGAIPPATEVAGFLAETL